MRISIWEQWASNHSSNFTVVGVFESAEAAQKAADELGRVFDAIEGWYEEHGYWDAVEAQRLNNGDIVPPTPPEIETAEHYGVEWLRGIDWFFGQNPEDYPITRFQNLVFVSNTVPHTWQGPEPFDVLMAQLGGQVYLDLDECPPGRRDQVVAVNLKCTATDRDKAEWIELVISDHVTTGNIKELGKFLLNDRETVGNTTFNIIERDDIHLHLKHLEFLDGVEEGLLQLIAYLEREGCKEFSYSFFEVPL